MFACWVRFPLSFFCTFILTFRVSSCDRIQPITILLNLIFDHHLNTSGNVVFSLIACLILDVIFAGAPIQCFKVCTYWYPLMTLRIRTHITSKVDGIWRIDVPALQKLRVKVISWESSIRGNLQVTSRLRCSQLSMKPINRKKFIFDVEA